VWWGETENTGLALFTFGPDLHILFIYALPEIQNQGARIMTESRFRFFLPEARLLEKDEIANLPPEKFKAVESAGKNGLWLEMVCPDESCIDDDGNITIPAEGVDTSREKGIFLNLFCPDNSCEIVESTDLP